MLYMQPVFRVDVLDQCVEGDQNAWCSLHEVYFPIVFGFLRAMGLRDADLEDGCQEVFMEIFRSLGRFEARSDFRTWLYRVCVTHAGRLRRRAGILAKVRWLIGTEQRSEMPVAGLEWDERQTIDRVQRSLDTLSPKHRLVLVLRDFEDLSVKEIAAVARCPESTVWTRLHYARKQFEKKLDESGATP
jgi:RNA polymerase sigma-70 factor (ECF subfamily)